MILALPDVTIDAVDQNAIVRLWVGTALKLGSRNLNN